MIRQALALLLFLHTLFISGALSTFDSFSGERAVTDSTQWTAVIVSSIGLLDTTLNWLYHFEKLSLGMPLVLIAEDTALADEESRALEHWFSHLDMTIVRAGGAPSSPSDTSDQYFGSSGYNKIVSRRGYHLRDLLQKGKDIIYSDVDTVWVQDPRPYLVADQHPELHGGDRMLWAAPGWNGYGFEVCTGFLAVKSTPQTQQLMQMWGDSLSGGEDRNQPMFNELLWKHAKEHEVRNVLVLKEKEFPRGDQYFKKSSWDRSRAVVVHASWIKGNAEKIKAFKKRGLWYES